MRVPRYQRQVESVGLPTPQFTGATPDQMGAGLARGMGQVADALYQEQEKANAVQVMSAQRQLSEWRLANIDDPEKGALARRGKDAFGLPETVAADYDKTVAEIEKGLGNERQRMAFQKLALADRDSVLRSVSRHVSGELKSYAETENKAYIETAANAAALNYLDPDRVDTEVQRARMAIMAHAKITGEPAEATNLRLTRAQSTIRRTVIERMADTDPMEAGKYLSKYADQMDADDILKVQGKVGKAVDAQVSMAVASEHVKKLQPDIAPTDMDRALNILLKTESGGRQFAANGQPLTSKAGAVGIAQVMPTTGPEAAKMAGLPWDEKRYREDADYNKALGRAYFAEQLRTNGGDLAKAYAAYNAGPGALQEAIKKAERSVSLNKNDPAVPVKGWLDFLPAETRNYVTKNLQAYEQGQGVASRPTFADIDNALRNDPRLASNPARYKLAREEAKRQFEEQTQALKQRDDEAVIQAQDMLVRNGGNFAGLPASVRDAIPRDRYDNLLDYAGKIAAGQPVTTDWNTYTQLRAMAVSQPEQFGRTDLRVHYPNLAPAQREALLDLQTKAKDPKQVPEVQTMAQQLATAHNLLGFRSGDAEKKGKFDDAVAQAVAIETRQKGRALTFEERDQIIKRQMLPTNAGWFGGKRMFEVSGTPQEATAKPKISDDDRKLIIAALKAEGQPTTEDAIASRFNLRYGIR